MRHIPPDEINIIEPGKNYGWPWCYGKQIRDESFKFISGWLKNGNISGRPVDILVRTGGLTYFTDDKAGIVYRVKWLG
ncbi:hypothetical protein A3A67_03985 [Candidatus Peribacteria bacterium RIFCSPLOWO2_01_FULL_51_18]|nr:MAG: hypothetical protein A3A67_03985 [Candidatus Peribacteria bacterium RIFCSPLOWO2_01_FULL_51_18]OGJ68426.1 MAG: hypothetical protein A3J34_00445 [Candidatus Peribacteria bacterium RIFCSPLOWO2_02_FULL_51_10]